MGDKHRSFGDRYMKSKIPEDRSSNEFVCFFCATTQAEEVLRWRGVAGLVVWLQSVGDKHKILIDIFIRRVAPFLVRGGTRYIYILHMSPLVFL